MPQGRISQRFRGIFGKHRHLANAVVKRGRLQFFHYRRAGKKTINVPGKIFVFHIFRRRISAFAAA